MSMQHYSDVSDVDLCNAISKYRNTDLMVGIKGALDFLLVLEDVNIITTEDKIYLVDSGVNEYRFEIWKHTIHLVDIMSDMVKLKIVDVDMITYLTLGSE